MNTKDRIIKKLRRLQLTTDEARMYIELLLQPSTHLQLSRATGINRTKVYRLAEQLEKRSLISRHVDDRGTFLVAHNPEQLEIDLLAKEEELREQQEAFQSLMPELALFKQENRRAFVVRTYEGEEGFKQMLWHEQKAKDEILFLGDSTLEDLIAKSRWTERYRASLSKTTLHVRAVFNSDPGAFTNHAVYHTQTTTRRFIDPAIITIKNQVAIYNDTVAIYHVGTEKIGVEIINAAYAATTRATFELYWKLATTHDPGMHGPDR